MLLFFVAGTLSVCAQKTVTGTVVDESNLPVSGANVVVKGTQVGVITDGSGKFSIVVPPTGTTLIFSFISYIPQEVQIGTSSVIDVTLQLESAFLGEVVVVGYGTRKGQQ